MNPCGIQNQEELYGPEELYGGLERASSLEIGRSAFKF